MASFSTAPPLPPVGGARMASGSAGGRLYSSGAASTSHAPASADAQLIAELNGRVRAAEEAAHALFDEAARMQRDLVAEATRHHDAMLAARSERDAIRAKQETDTSAYMVEMQAVIAHAKKSDEKVSKLEQRVLSLEKILQTHAAMFSQQHPVITATQTGLAELTTRANEEAEARVGLHQKIDARLTEHEGRIEEMNRDLDGIADLGRRTAAHASTLQSAHDAAVTRALAADRAGQDRAAKLEMKIQTTVQQAMAHADRAVADAVGVRPEAIETAVAPIRAAVATADARGNALEVALREVAERLSGEARQLHTQASAAVAAAAQRAQQLATLLATETETRKNEFQKSAEITEGLATATSARLTELKTALERHANNTAETTVEHERLLKTQAEVTSRLAESSAKSLKDVQVSIDADRERLKAELIAELNGLKATTSECVMQLNQSTQILERELSVTGESLRTVLDAEIRLRQRTDLELQEGIERLNEQDTAHHYEQTVSVEKLTELTTKVCDELKRKISIGLGEQEEIVGSLKMQTDTRLTQLVEHVGKSEENTMQSLTGISSNLDQEHQFSSKQLQMLEDRTTRQVEKLMQKIDFVPLQIQEAMQQVDALRAELMARVEKESQEVASTFDAMHMAVSRKADSKVLDMTSEKIRSRLTANEDVTHEVRNELKKVQIEGTASPTELVDRVQHLEHNMERCLEHFSKIFGSAPEDTENDAVHTLDRHLIADSPLEPVPEEEDEPEGVHDDINRANAWQQEAARLNNADEGDSLQASSSESENEADNANAEEDLDVTNAVLGELRMGAAEFKAGDSDGSAERSAADGSGNDSAADESDGSRRSLTDRDIGDTPVETHESINESDRDEKYEQQEKDEGSIIDDSQATTNETRDESGSSVDDKFTIDYHPKHTSEANSSDDSSSDDDDRESPEIESVAPRNRAMSTASVGSRMSVRSYSMDHGEYEQTDARTWKLHVP